MLACDSSAARSTYADCWTIYGKLFCRRHVLSRMKKKAVKAVTRPGKSRIIKLEPAEAPVINPKWTWHYRTLVALRERLLREAATRMHDVSEAIEPHSMHAADSGTDEFDHDLALALFARTENALGDVNAAIDRIVQGTYGWCEKTGARISARRLRALPWCRYTREVEQRLEQTGVVPKHYIPELVSIRGADSDISERPRQASDAGGEEPDESEELQASKVVARLSKTSARDIEPISPLAKSAVSGPGKAVGSRRDTRPSRRSKSR